MPFIINAIISSLSLFLLLPAASCFLHAPAYAANLSINIGKDSTSVAAGRDFGFGYGVLGISATFITEAPWSYVSTTGSLNKPCTDFQSDPTKDCEPRGRFYDGDEWEVFGKLGYRLPPVSKMYLNTGMGISRQKIASLYIFCVGIEGNDDAVKGCSKARLFETWGQVDEDYFLTFLGGLTVEMTHRFLFNIDYHTRKGLLTGLMWRF